MAYDSFYVSLPLSDYIAICDKIRELLRLDSSIKITSDEIPDYVHQIAQLNRREGA